MALKVKRAERLVEVCLDGALVAEYEAVEAELESKRKERLADVRLNDPVTKLELKKAELREAQKAETVVFKLRALPRAVWSQLKLDHPAREGNTLDENLGFNTDTIFDAAMKTEGTFVEVTKAGKKEPFKVEEWDEFSADLSKGQFEPFRAAINSLNEDRPEVPFSLTGYKMIQDSAENSK